MVGYKLSHHMVMMLDECVDLKNINTLSAVHSYPGWGCYFKSMHDIIISCALKASIWFIKIKVSYWL